MRGRWPQRFIPSLLALMIVGVSLSGTAAAMPHAAPQDTAKAGKSAKGGDAGEAKVKKEKKTRTPEEEAKRTSKRAEKAEKLPLFNSLQPLAFSLIANFGDISKDRDTLSKKQFDGKIVVKDDSGAERMIPVKLRTRGHFRLMSRNCRFVNMLVSFPKKETKGTPFDDQKDLKLGSHCQNDGRYEQYLLKEYLAYRLYHQVTDVSFRTRLSTATYVDAESGRTLETKPAFWIENEDDVAARSDGEMKTLRRALFDDVDPEALDNMLIYAYAIGNTDWSVHALHNVRLIRQDNGTVLTVPYDFDFSGLVDTHYASTDPSLPIRDVRQRLYRGACRTPEVMQERLELWRTRKDSVLAEVDHLPGLDGREARHAKEYLGEFFKTIASPRDVKRDLIDGCLSKPGA
ncbi:MAG: hypothetical protein ABIZ91_05640 [Gemmatimonadaceae bacterium]